VNIPSNILTLLAGVVITGISLWYGQHHGLLPIAASSEAKQVDELFNFMMTIATGLFVLIQGLLIIVAIKFRKRQGDNTDGPPIEGNVPLEILWTSIPTVIVFILSIYSFEVYNNMGGLDPMAAHDMGPKMAHHQHSESVSQDLIALDTDARQVALGLGAAPGTNELPLVVDVNGIQYAWLFTYPANGIVSGDLHVPIDKPVQLNIRAGDVLHAFWLPEFRIKQDAIPGRDAVLAFTPTRLGQYPIICAELCGSYHGGMKTTLFVQSQEDYDKWYAQNSPVPETEAATKEVALNPKHLSPGEFLAPYAKEMGIKKDTLAQLHS
jgi:cytochrome c oxidase subunit 2